MADTNAQDPPRSRNRLLAGLPKYDYEHLEPFLRPVSMSFKEVLHKQGEPIRDVIFPAGAVCSLLKNMNDGGVVEIATIGGEGAVGAGAFLDDQTSLTESIVQVTDGDGYAMPIATFTTEMSEDGAFCRAIRRFSHALLHQIAQTAVCNALHTHEERGCRWLLMTHDRAGKDSFQLTDELLGVMMGARRPSVTLVAATLARAGFIDFQDGVMTILDRRGLEEVACECYGSVATAYRRILLGDL